MNGRAPAENQARPAARIDQAIELAPTLVLKMMARIQRTNWPASTLQIIDNLFVMTAMVGK